MGKEFWNTIVIMICLYAVTAIHVYMVTFMAGGLLITSCLCTVLCGPYLYYKIKDYFDRRIDL
jgi:hypothetical protein